MQIHIKALKPIKHVRYNQMPSFCAHLKLWQCKCVNNQHTMAVLVASVIFNGFYHCCCCWCPRICVAFVLTLQRTANTKKNHKSDAIKMQLARKKIYYRLLFSDALCHCRRSPVNALPHSITAIYHAMQTAYLWRFASFSFFRASRVCVCVCSVEYTGILLNALWIKWWFVLHFTVDVFYSFRRDYHTQWYCFY